jgi:hypothetical protein
MNKGIELLRELAFADSRLKHPTLPESARFVRRYSDKTANGLAKCIIDLLRFSGHQCERVAVTGRYIDNSKVVTDVTGSMRRIGSGKWIPPSMQPGTADLSATINGRSVKIELKIGRDKQSEAQKKYQDQVEKAGGIYLLVHSLDEFLTYYNQLV